MSWQRNITLWYLNFSYRVGSYISKSAWAGATSGGGSFGGHWFNSFSKCSAHLLSWWSGPDNSLASLSLTALIDCFGWPAIFFVMSYNHLRLSRFTMPCLFWSMRFRLSDVILSFTCVCSPNCNPSGPWTSETTFYFCPGLLSAPSSQISIMFLLNVPDVIHSFFCGFILPSSSSWHVDSRLTTVQAFSILFSISPRLRKLEFIEAEFEVVFCPWHWHYAEVFLPTVSASFPLVWVRFTY